MKKPIIKYSFIYRHSKAWLKENQYRFSCSPYIKSFRRDSFTLAFKGVKNISVTFNKSGIIDVWCWTDKKFTLSSADILTDFDIAERKSGLGYYCECCDPTTFYKNRQMLWDNEVFEPLLKWANEKLLPDNYLCIYQTEDKGGLWAKIKKSSELEQDKDLKHRTFLSPIITSAQKYYEPNHVKI